MKILTFLFLLFKKSKILLSFVPRSQKPFPNQFQYSIIHSKLPRGMHFAVNSFYE